MFRAIFLAVATALFATSAFATTFTYSGRVIKVIDGDTIKVEIAGWPAPFNPIDVRVDGIDTPEKHMPPAKSACEVKLGVAASAYARTVISVGSTITIVYDDKKRDKYGRLLGRVILADGRDYSALMISKGYAKPYSGATKSIWC